MSQRLSSNVNELVLFAGAGGSILASQLLGWRVVAAVELEHYCRESLMARQDDGSLEPFPIWDDIISFDGKPWRGVVDCVSGGFPCVGISPERLNARYGKQIGLDDPKSGLWAHQLRVIGEVEPAVARVENHPNLTRRGLGAILGALSEMGYDAQGAPLPADCVGAPHERERLWIEVANPDFAQRQGIRLSRRTPQEIKAIRSNIWWKTEPGIRRVDDGVANRVDRLRATGNGQVPAVAELAWEGLKP